MQVQPIKRADLRKGILVPEERFDQTLEELDWTWHQIARNEFPHPFTDLDEFQMAIICADPFLWCQAFLREPEDPDHQDPYNFFDYQVESLVHDGSTIHKCGAEVGKTREIVAKCLYLVFNRPNGSGLIGAPQQIHLEEIIEAMLDQLSWNEDLGKSLTKHKKMPHHAFYFNNSFKIDFRPSGHDGVAYRGVHVKTFAIKDEAAKDKNKKQWSEFWRAMKPGCIAGLYSVPDGDRSCEFFRLAQKASSSKEEVAIDSFKDVPAHVKALNFKLFKWSKTLMPSPFWSEERRRFYIDQFGGEDSPEYKHNVLGEDGDPENTVFPWHQFQWCIKDVPEYRCLKVMVNSSRNEVALEGYRCRYTVTPEGPAPDIERLIDTVEGKTHFFDADETQESQFTRLIKSFFVSVPGLKRGGADLGFSGDPTEIIIKNIVGKKERMIARLQLKHVTYDQQCEALNAIDDFYHPEDTTWGTDFGNAGSAVAHDLQGLERYEHKSFEDRLSGFMFASVTDNVDEEGEAVLDAKSGKPAKITLKELATDLLTKKMQRLELEYPADPDVILYYTNHTERRGEQRRIFKKQDDHIIDADRVQKLAQVMALEMEDYFA